MSKAQYSNSWASLDSRPIPPWFQKAKFGIFVHWGPYSVPAYRKPAPGLYASYAEWYYASVMYDNNSGGREFHTANYGSNFEYRDFGPMFRAELFSPDLWADIFRRSGAGYVVFTAKHHDGYCLWPTKSPCKANWNSMSTGPGKDLIGSLTASVRKAGLKMGLYYSVIEWESNKTHRTKTGYFLPDSIVSKYGIPEEEYIAHMNFQLRELVTEYQPSLLFSDGGEWDFSSDYWKTRDFLAWLYNDSPVKNEVVVNDRFSKDMPGMHGDYYSSEYHDVPGGISGHPWEESRGIGESYGFNRAESLSDYSTSKELIHELISVVSRGGNFLLNIGPEADGRIPLIMQERLLDIGNWLSVNGDAVYGSTGRAVPVQGNLHFTVKPGKLFLIFTNWTQTVEADLLANELPEAVNLLGCQCCIYWKLHSRKLIISLPALTVDEIPCLHAWVLRVDLKHTDNRTEHLEPDRE
jgi:alpha-L-fucosidase